MRKWSAPAAFIAILLLVVSPPASAETARAGDPSPWSTTIIEGTASTSLKQAEQIEAELAQTPGDESLLANLVDARIDAADAMVSDNDGDSQGGVKEIKRQLTLAGQAWWRYLKAAKKPDVGLAARMAPGFFQRAELSSSSREALKYVKAAAGVQQIVAEGRPGKTNCSTLAYYDLFAQRYNAADEEIERVVSYANTKFERESIEKKFEEVEKYAKRFGKRLKSR